LTAGYVARHPMETLVPSSSSRVMGIHNTLRLRAIWDPHAETFFRRSNILKLLMANGLFSFSC